MAQIKYIFLWMAHLLGDSQSNKCPNVNVRLCFGTKNWLKIN